MFPRFSLHGMPEPHIEGHTSGGSRAREPSGHEGAGGVEPSSVTSLTPADLGLATQPAGTGRNALMPHLYLGDSFMPVDVPGDYYVRGRKTSSGFHTATSEALYQRDPASGIYAKTGLRVHRGSDGHWVLDDVAPLRAASTSPQPGPSGVSSSRPAAGVEVPHVLEDLLSRAQNREPWRQYHVGKKDGKPFHVFHDERMPSTKAPALTVPNRLQGNRQKVVKAVAAVIVDLHYEVVIHNEGHDRAYLVVTNPQTRKQFPVYVKQSSSNSYQPLSRPPIGERYLMAMVNADPVSGELRTLHFIPFFHPWRTF